MKFQKANCLKGEITVPGDKSISHRAVMFGALSEGKTEITNFPRRRLPFHYWLFPPSWHRNQK